jgi:hypothetical protein
MPFTVKKSTIHFQDSTPIHNQADPHGYFIQVKWRHFSIQNDVAFRRASSDQQRRFQWHRYLVRNEKKAIGIFLQNRAGKIVRTSKLDSN